MKFNKNAFALMRKQAAFHDRLREEIIKVSRDALALSKKAIYSLHRNETPKARLQLGKAKRVIDRLHKMIGKDAHLAATGPYLEALEEYVEAACYYSLLVKNRLPTPRQLGVDIDTYLPGLCDLVGELVRKAINSAIKGDNRTCLLYTSPSPRDS